MPVGELGGMTSKITDVIGYEVQSALRRSLTLYAFFFFPAGERQMH